MGLEELGLDGGEGISDEALEKLVEQMKENAAAIRAMKQQEKKQRDKDNKLVAILMRFIKGNKNQALVELIVRLLNENVPATFILAIVLLGNDEIQKELGIILTLPAGFRESQIKLLNSGTSNISNEMSSEEKEDFSLNTEKKLILKIWTQSVIEASLENPYKILRTVKDIDGEIKSTAIQLVSFIIRDFFEKDLKGTIDFEEIRNFGKAALTEILHEVEKKTAQGQLEGK